MHQNSDYRIIKYPYPPPPAPTLAVWSPSVLYDTATIPAWRSYRVVCAAVAIGVRWPSSMPDAVRHLQDTADVLAAYGCRPGSIPLSRRARHDPRRQL